MNEAEKARANAITLEIKKDGLTQRQSGDWQLRFTVAGIDMDQRLASAPMGTRFQCVLVEINDDETPVDHQAEIRAKWRELGATRQAGIRCKDPVFWAFLEERMNASHINNESRAANFVRMHCHVDTRADLDRPGFQQQRILWNTLDSAFYAWKALENA